MSHSRFTATYLIETAHDPEAAAAMMAGEQSAGTFVRVPGETNELRARHSASVESVTVLDEVDTPSLPGTRPPKNVANPRYRRARVVLSFPAENVGASLSALVTTVAGNLFELSPFSGLRLLDLTIPPAFIERYPGPQFGAQGTRALTGVSEGALIGTIIKPSVGLSPQQTAALVKVLADAGLDFIKDDELIANPPYSPLAERVDAVMHVVNEHADRTGKRVMVAFNISGEIDEMLHNHDLVLAAGGNCVMVNLLSVGLSAVSYLRRHSRLPIHGHRNGWGALSRHPLLGFDFRAYQKFWRLAGVDHLHVNGLRNKFCEEDESVIASARACQTPLFDAPGKAHAALPVFSSGQWASQAPDTYAALGNSDLLYLAGGGIMGHPDGPAAGARSLREAWVAAVAGIPLADYEREHPALAAAFRQFGSVAG
ncbi:MAG: ribulose-bisphosphate carboxylase large subunit family protein [Caldilineaceae bacterium]|nr:ribulose-bisphosphate carboxylase large subunit family protein [Caldilineaceae bacterium]